MWSTEMGWADFSHDVLILSQFCHVRLSYIAKDDPKREGYDDFDQNVVAFSFWRLVFDAWFFVVRSSWIKNRDDVATKILRRVLAYFL